MDRRRADHPKHPQRGVALLLFTLLLAPILSSLGIPLAAAADPDPVPGANAQPDAICEKSAEATNLATGTYRDARAAAMYPTNNYQGSVIMGDDVSRTGSDNVTIGMRHPFSGVYLKMFVAGVGGSVFWRYWDGTQWKTLDILSDGTSNMALSGKVSWHPPGDWQLRRWNPRAGMMTSTGPNTCYDARLLYYVQIQSNGLYSTQPLADQVGVLMANLKLKVQTELGEPVAGLQASDFEITEGTDSTIFDLREPSPGSYELGLDTAGSKDHTFRVGAIPQGFVRSGTLDTGTMDVVPTDKTDAPLVLGYPIKVTVKDEENQSVAGAVVKWGGLDPDASPSSGNVHYFKGTVAGELAVSAAGHDPFSTATNTAARNLYPGILAATRVTLGGTAPCAGTSEIAAGATVTCQGLHRIPGASTSSTPTSAAATTRPLSFSFPSTPPRSTAPRATTPDSTPSAPPCEQAAVPADGLYKKSVPQVSSEDLVRLCLDQAAAAGVERIDVSLGMEAHQVEVRAEPVPEFQSSWSEAGVDPPPGDYHFGFLDVGVHVNGVAWTGPVEATSFRFHLARSNLAQAGLTAEDVQVYRWDGDAWEAVLTGIDSESESDYAFTASAPGQGLFAVSGVSAAEVPSSPVWPWIVGGFMALGLVGLGVATVVRRRHAHHESLDEEPHEPPKPVLVPSIK